jgi:hypothetical protein
MIFDNEKCPDIPGEEFPGIQDIPGKELAPYLVRMGCFSLCQKWTRPEWYC